MQQGEIMPKCAYARCEQRLFKPNEGFFMTLHTHPLRGCPGCSLWVHGASSMSSNGKAALTKNACSSSAGLQPPRVALCQPMQNSADCASSEPQSPALPCVRFYQSCTLLGIGAATACHCIAQWWRQWYWKDLCGAGGVSAPHTMPVGAGVADPGWYVALQGGSDNPRKSAPLDKLGWHPCVCRKNFPLGKAVCIFALIRLQRNAKGAREMKHILSQPNGQTNTGKKASVSDQMNSDQNSGFKMEIGPVLKSWVASQHVQREQIHSSKLCPAAAAPVRVSEQLWGSAAAHPTPPRGEGLWRRWAPSSPCLSRV